LGVLGALFGGKPPKVPVAMTLWDWLPTDVYFENYSMLPNHARWDIWLFGCSAV